MPADVNVTEKAAGAEAQRRYRKGVATGPLDEQRAFVAGALWHRARGGDFERALSDPEALAGVAGVLREHGDSRQSAGGFLLVCRCGDAVDDHADHQAAAVVDWLRGQR